MSDQAGHQLRFAYSTINWGTDCDIPKALREIRETGWGAVELFGHSLDQLGTPASLRRALADLTVATMFSVVEVPAAAGQPTTHRHRIEFAAEMGATDYGLVGGTRPRFRPPSAAEYAELAEICEELARFGSTSGIAVNYHPHVGCTIETSSEIDVLLGQSPAILLCLDASHIALVDEDPIAVLDRYWDRLGYVHLKDWGRGKFQELGRGTIGIDFSGILTHLSDRNFDGWVVLEQSQSDVSPAESAKVNAAFLTDLGFDIAFTGSTR